MARRTRPLAKRLFFRGVEAITGGGVATAAWPISGRPSPNFRCVPAMKFEAARRSMIDSQLRPNKVTDQPLLDAMAVIPREEFVPAAYHSVAYVDEDVPLGNGRFLLEPMVLARLVQAAAPARADRVLDVGSATGYGAAILAGLASEVVGLEFDGALADRANALLAARGSGNAMVLQGPLEQGVPPRAPFNAIVIEGLGDFVPPMLLDQLADGGRLAAIVRDRGVGRAMIYTRNAGVVSARALFDASVAPLPGLQREAGFVF
jgi:protein-L-isoaspartate(D-aspartate) O-methyltransferase